MAGATTRARQMARDANTRENFIAWQIQEFGFNTNAATSLHDVQMLEDAMTLSELDDDAIANICKAVSKDTGQSVAEIAATKIKLACFWIRHQIRTLREMRDQGDCKTTCEDLLQWDHRPLSTAEVRQRQLGCQ
jgi:hypothetical protein